MDLENIMLSKARIKRTHTPTIWFNLHETKDKYYLDWEKTIQLLPEDVSRGGWQKEQRKPLEMMEMVYILNVVIVAWVHKFVKRQWI